MAYTVEPESGDIIISGFDNGIGDSELSGITDAKSVNPVTIPGEVSAAFSTGSVFACPSVSNQSGSVTTGTNYLLVDQSIRLEERQWVVFNSITTGGTGLSLNTPYYLVYSTSIGANRAFNLVAQTSRFPPSGGAVAIGADSAVTFSTVNPSTPKYFTKTNGNNWMIDSSGRVWSDYFGTIGGGSISATNSWVWMGNPIVSGSSNGNGITSYTSVYNATGGTGTPAQFEEWIFVWRNSQIDYAQVTSLGSSTNPTWVTSWKPSLGTVAASSSDAYLQTQANASENSHHALVDPNGRVNYCDKNYIGVFYQNVPTVGSNYVGFNPLNTSTYTFQNITAVVPPDDTAQCLAFLNQFLLVGGKKNIIYPWNLNPGDNTYSPPLIVLPESNVQGIITGANNGYIFAGNRGIIYITNGSQANFYKKIPDHISGVVEPIFYWGGSNSTSGNPTGIGTFQKDRLYFGFTAIAQTGGGALNGYGGIWCIDINTGILFNTGQLSYGTYGGYASAILAAASGTVNGVSYGPTVGYGLLAGWNDGSQTSGVDASRSTPYSSGQSYVISDAIPVGTLLKPNTPHQVEFKLSTPLSDNESINISVAPYLNGTFTSAGTTTGVTGSGIISGNFAMPIEKMQWALIKATLTSTNTSPTYCRLTQLRIVNK